MNAVKENQFLDISRKGRQLHIRIPDITGDTHYCSALEKLGSTLSRDAHTPDVVVQVERPFRTTLSLAAALLRLKKDIEQFGRSFKIVTNH